ncbi:LOW QUALITY PROTEIN: hypothetical protein PHMEG_00010532 [Phytophthora megakarya]|uniref:Uncharacterized protein n=1 Tax=Phytophthora megakarya TaxID=4795 RepID=A0A225WDH4_9STRA|nr:LOW QUALITY PROTEIN: hypothetical protein PHMEG_00010532 [Phytophthora megakarya]
MWNNIQVSASIAAFRGAGITFPSILSLDPRRPASDIYQLNKHLRPVIPDYVQNHYLKALVNSFEASDYRPNKALLPAILIRECMGYPRLNDLIRIASEGVRVNLTSPLPTQTRFPNNHISASTRINVLRKNIRKEQDSQRCIVVDADLIKIWPEIYVSPFGVIGKGDHDPRFLGRVIHDFSFPEDGSVNNRTDHSDIAKATYNHFSSVACDITRCQRAHPSTDVKVMSDDVATAYRNACIHSNCITSPKPTRFLSTCLQLLGGSTGMYGYLGRAVTFIHGNHTDAINAARFVSCHSVDDHINVDPDVGSHCSNVYQSLRYAMATATGPGAVNEEKFTPWITQQKVLGLIFDTLTSTVAMPALKIAKAQRIEADELRDLHPPRTSFLAVATRWRAPATTSIPNLPDGSNAQRLGALVPSRRLAHTYQFQPGDRKLIDEFKAGETNEFDINYRELLACAFATHAWGETWRSEGAQDRSTHVHFRVDNATAVSWQSILASRNSRAQLQIRLLSIWGHGFGLRLSSSHIPGVENITADARSCRWQNTA